MLIRLRMIFNYVTEDGVLTVSGVIIVSELLQCVLATLSMHFYKALPE